MSKIARTSVIGAGLIGASWTALFLASGRSVAVFDPATGTEAAVRDHVRKAWPAMTEIGLTKRGDPDRITFHASPEAAVEGADFIQESVPERMAMKHDTFARIEPHLSSQAIIASSASGLTLGQMQKGWRSPGRFILGHPFNPPHLIPLVELMANENTLPGVIEAAEAFYADIGKTTIRVQKEVPGHVANRLQAAIWREAIHLVESGVASVGDVDKAIASGPGLRWATMGPTTLFGLGAGQGGLAAFCDHFADTFNGWWDDLGSPRLTDANAQLLEQGLAEANEGRTVAELSQRRDAMLVAIQRALAELEPE